MFKKITFSASLQPKPIFVDGGEDDDCMGQYAQTLSLNLFQINPDILGESRVEHLSPRHDLLKRNCGRMCLFLGIVSNKQFKKCLGAF